MILELAYQASSCIVTRFDGLARFEEEAGTLVVPAPFHSQWSPPARTDLSRSANI